MNKLIFTLSVLLFGQRLHAQADLYFRLKNIIEQTHPEINMDNKLLAVNVWSIDDAESREANKGFEKAYATYQNARLKGGLRGLVVVTVSKDDLSATATIMLSKDGIFRSIHLKLEDLKAQIEPATTKNLVFDANGTPVYKNLTSASVFNTFHQLITR